MKCCLGHILDHEGNIKDLQKIHADTVAQLPMLDMKKNVRMRYHSELH